mmetsp:Transcript_49771/g.166321  ORF Transcript_49771/g.166321 Transcript_49771/m.166321 type:complete len:314 (+) Transcript_49771:336-1277(+)
MLRHYCYALTAVAARAAQRLQLREACARLLCGARQRVGRGEGHDAHGAHLRAAFAEEQAVGYRHALRVEGRPLGAVVVGVAARQRVRDAADVAELALARARDVIAASRLLHEREAVWARLCRRHRPLREGRVLPAQHMPQHVPLASVAELLEPPLVPVAEEAALCKVLDDGLRKRFAAAGHRAARMRDAIFDLHAYPLAEAYRAEVVVASGHWEARTQRATDATLHIQRAELHTGATRDSLRLVLRCLAPARGDKACGARALDVTSDDSRGGKLRRLGRLSGRKELAHSVGANLDEESIAARVFHAGAGLCPA